MTTDSRIYTPREAILHSASLLKSNVIVQGTVVLVDSDKGRMDIAHNGAKLIVRLPSETCPAMGEDVRVSGVLRKEQRRTFLNATGVEKISTEN